MEINKKYALLDTDFLYKAHLARQSIAGLSKPINCISILGIFHKLKELGYGKSEMRMIQDANGVF